MADFATLKQNIGIKEVCDWLGIALTSRNNGAQYRGTCPICDSTDKTAFVITPAKELFFCHKCNNGGDIIGLTSKVMGVRMAEAGTELAKHFGLDTKRKEQPKEQPHEAQAQEDDQLQEAQAQTDEPETAASETAGGLKPLDYLQISHDAMKQLKMPPKVRSRIGIGYAPRGLMRGTVAFPMRASDGTLICYVGVKPENVEALVLPKNF